MDPRVKNLWLEELRSGRHEQTRGVLCDADGHKCCLGVLADLAVREGVVESRPVPTHERGLVSGYGESAESHTLPPEIQEWAGLTSDSPRVSIPEGVEIGEWKLSTHEPHLTTLNDSAHWSFEQIADVIEVGL